MKIFISLTLSFLMVKSVFGQYLIAGEYREFPAANNFFYGSKLRLNCDNTFFRNDSAYLKDSVSLVYGKWNISNGTELTLFIDSVLAWGQTDYPKTKLKYIVQDNKIYNKSISKKDYNFFAKRHRRKKMTMSESFEEFQKRELSRYFEMTQKFDCH